MRPGIFLGMRVAGIFNMQLLTALSAPSKERRNSAARRALVDRVRTEFSEMPGERLTSAQAQRLFAMRPDICERVLAALEREGVLTRGIDGRYGSRRDSALVARRR
jgi:hypothetical protein